MKTNWAEKVWVNGPLRVYFQQREVRFFKKLRRLGRLSSVLEIGCGQGTGISLIVRHFHPCTVEGIDLDPAMVRRAERRVRGLGGDGVTVVRIRVGDAERLPFPDSSMDAVFNFGIIHHLEDWMQGIREVARVMKPGGVFYFEEIYPALYANLPFRYLLLHPREDRFRGPEYRTALGRAGLRLLDGYRESRYTILGAATRA